MGIFFTLLDIKIYYKTIIVRQYISGIEIEKMINETEKKNPEIIHHKWYKQK